MPGAAAEAGVGRARSARGAALCRAGFEVGVGRGLVFAACPALGGQRRVPAVCVRLVFATHVEGRALARFLFIAQHTTGSQQSTWLAFSARAVLGVCNARSARAAVCSSPSAHTRFGAGDSPWHSVPALAWLLLVRSAPATRLLSGMHSSNWCLQCVCGRGVCST